MRKRLSKNERSPKPVILVICEGETEEKYVEFLKWIFRLPITIRSKIAGNRISSRLVNRFIEELNLSDKGDSNIFICMMLT